MEGKKSLLIFDECKSDWKPFQEWILWSRRSVLIMWQSHPISLHPGAGMSVRLSWRQAAAEEWDVQGPGKETTDKISSTLLGLNSILLRKAIWHYIIIYNLSHIYNYIHIFSNVEEQNTRNKLGQIKNIVIKTTEPNLKWPKHISTTAENGPDTVIQYTVCKKGIRT